MCRASNSGPNDLRICKERFLWPLSPSTGPVSSRPFWISSARTRRPARRRPPAEIGYRILADLGFECEFDDAGDKVGGTVGNLIAFKKGTIPDAPPIFFSAHFDTVEPTPGLEPVFDGEIIRSGGDTILGADDKCGMAPILEAMRI